MLALSAVQAVLGAHLQCATPLRCYNAALDAPAVCVPPGSSNSDPYTRGQEEPGKHNPDHDSMFCQRACCGWRTTSSAMPASMLACSAVKRRAFCPTTHSVPRRCPLVVTSGAAR